MVTSHWHRSSFLWAFQTPINQSSLTMELLIIHKSLICMNINLISKSSWIQALEVDGWWSLISLVTMVTGKEKFGIELWHVCFGMRQVSLGELTDCWSSIPYQYFWFNSHFISSICSSNLIPTVPLFLESDPNCSSAPRVWRSWQKSTCWPIWKTLIEKKYLESWPRLINNCSKSCWLKSIQNDVD